MDLLIKPKKLKGKLDAISSKAFAHRAIICACLSEGESIIKNVNFCDDINATINCLREIVKIKKDGKDLIIQGGISKFGKHSFYVNNSASTLRFLLPLISYFNESESNFMLGDQLSERPIDEYQKLFIKKNAPFQKEKNVVKTKNFPDENVYSISAENSSQYISGLLFLAPCLAHDTTINIKGKINSANYIKLTIFILQQFGINVKWDGSNIFVIGNQKYQHTSFSVPSDLSFLMNVKVMNLLGSNIEIENLLTDKNDPDYDMYNQLGDQNDLDFRNIDFCTNPDLVPPLAIYSSCVSKTTSHFDGVNRLKFKESDRVNSIIKVFSNLGAKAEYIDNNLIIYPSSFSGGIINTFNDHRIAFMGVVASTISSGDIIIKDFDCVSKSYKDFLSDFYQLGLDFEPIDQNKELEFSLNGKTTKIVFGKNSFNAIQNYTGNNKTVIITDNKVPNAYVSRLVECLNKANTLIYKLDANGEEIKSFKYLEQIIKYLIDNEISKTDKLIAVGGGTITDLVGFVSMIYKRGIDFISVPTTLIAQADAAIGGKVAIDDNQTKNCVGGFYNPSLIIVDPTMLSSLEEKDFKSGMAEIIKIFALTNPKMFFDVFDSKPYSNLVTWIFESIKEKLKFVKIDPYDKNERHALNFGHTYGHAIEILTQYMTHGEAIAKGMAIVSDNPYLQMTLVKYGFSLSNKFDRDKLNQYIKNDKKIENGKLQLVLLENIGEYSFKEVDINE